MSNRFTKIAYPLLARKRRERGLTNEQIAEAIGIRHSRWRGLLVGKCLLSREQAERAAELLDVPLEEIPYRNIPAGAAIEAAA